MTEAWFDPNSIGAIMGVSLGLAGGLEGTLAGLLAPRGKCRGLVMGMHFLFLGVCAVLLILGIIALADHQPYGVWYGLGFPGLLGLVIFGALTPVLRKRYREAEMHRSIALDT